MTNRAKEVMKKIAELNEMGKLTLSDPAIKNVAHELGFNTVDATENTEDHMVFDHGGKQLILDRTGGKVTFTFDGKVIHSAPESAFDLKNPKDWEPILAAVKA